jgi:F-type H+-transporting ATPase subunit gamma
MSTLNEIQGRLENIRTVEPIVGALRTISLGSWQAALRRRRSLLPYTEQLRMVLPVVIAHLEHPHDGLLAHLRRQLGGRGKPERSSPQRVRIVAVGSERGLVGGFNDVVAREGETYLAEQMEQGRAVELMVLGSRLARHFRRAGTELTEVRSIPVTALIPFSLAYELTQHWLARFEREDLDAVDLVYNAYRGPGDYQPQVERLIPPEIPEGRGATDLPEYTIVETDPLSLYTRVIEQWTAIRLYTLLLDAAAAEHAARYQLMEGAADNAERLIEELTQDLQRLRRQAITQEMQELAVGAGLLDE